MMRLEIRQYQLTRVLWCVPERRRTITPRDRAHADRNAAHCEAVTRGYYDLILTDGHTEYDATLEIK